VHRLSSLIFSSTACTKSSFTTDGRPLHGLSCTFLRPSLNSRTYLCAIQLLMAFSSYTSQGWWWISASFMFFAFKKQITDCISHAAGNLYFLKHYKHTARCLNTVRKAANCVCALTKNQQTRHACAPSWPQRCGGSIRKRNLFSG
jgi:hypothetical protein